VIDDSDGDFALLASIGTPGGCGVLLLALAIVFYVIASNNKSDPFAVVFKMFPHQKNLYEALGDLFGNSDQSVSAVRAFVTLMNAAPVQAVVHTVADLPKGGVELRATNLPR